MAILDPRDASRDPTPHAPRLPPQVMSILKHSDPEVQKHALTAVQRLMVINWDLLAVGK